MRIVLTGGGTGGHIYPLTAFAAYLKKVEPGSEILYIGSERGLESGIVPQYGLDFQALDIQGIKRSLSLDNIKTGWKLVRSRSKAKNILTAFKPDLVLGTGGYVAGPVMLAAISLGIPTLIHEQNLMPGVTNKALSKRVDKVAVSFEASAQYFPADKVVYTGNPRAQELADSERSHQILTDLGLDPTLPTVAIFGGSGGAERINAAFIAALPHLASQDYQVIYAAGKWYYEANQKEFLAYKDQRNLVIRPYIDQMGEVLGAVQLFLGRSGATTVAEVTALGLPAIFVPSPNVTGDQQRKNAKIVVEKGGALLIEDEKLTETTLIQGISQLLSDKVKYREMTKASLAAGVPDASQRLYHLIQTIHK